MGVSRVSAVRVPTTSEADRQTGPPPPELFGSSAPPYASTTATVLFSPRWQHQLQRMALRSKVGIRKQMERVFSNVHTHDMKTVQQDGRWRVSNNEPGEIYHTRLHTLYWCPWRALFFLFQIKSLGPEASGPLNGTKL